MWPLSLGVGGGIIYLSTNKHKNITVIPTEEVKQEMLSMLLLFIVVLLSFGRLSDRNQIDQLTMRDKSGKYKRNFLLYSSEGKNHSKSR